MSLKLEQPVRTGRKSEQSVRTGRKLEHPVRAERKRRGWTVAFLAKKTGVGESTISDIENGETLQTCEYTANALADGLEIQRRKLFSDRDLLKREEASPSFGFDASGAPTITITLTEFCPVHRMVLPLSRKCDECVD